MRYGNLPGLDRPLSRLIIGANQLPTAEDEDAAMAQMDAALALGINAFDTAYTYSGGEKDRFFGRWMAARPGVRDRIVIIAKGAHPTITGGPPRVTPNAIASDLEEILVRMGVAHVDLYLLHRDDPMQSVGPIIDALNRLVQEGKTQAFGASNWSVERLAEADRYAQETGQTSFAASSPGYSLAVWSKPPWPGCVGLSGPDAAADRRWYAARPMPVLAWSALASGFWSGRWRSRQDLAADAGDYWADLIAATYATQENFERLIRAERLGAEKGVSAAQIALAYALGTPDLDVYAVVGTGNTAHLSANIAAIDIALTAAERAYLEGV